MDNTSGRNFVIRFFPKYFAIGRKSSKTIIALEGKPIGPYPFRLFLLSLGPTYGQVITSKAISKLVSLPCQFLFSRKKNFLLDKELYVDKSVLSTVSKVFQSYFHNENINSIDIVDVSSNDMIELLQFLYPQFQCTINYENVTILLILGRSSIDMTETSLFLVNT
jgi:hypothetical protein